MYKLERWEIMGNDRYEIADMRNDYPHDKQLEHLEECGCMAWTCNHAKISFQEWKEREHRMELWLDRWYGRDFDVKLDTKEVPNLFTAGESLRYESDVAREGVEEMNTKLKELSRQRDRREVKRGKVGGNGLQVESSTFVENAFGRREGSRWTSFDEVDNYVRCARKRHLESSFTCDCEECVKKNCNGDAHDDKCKMEDLRYLLSDDWDCLSLPMNKKDIRK